ncbi:MAG: hypothetical protein JWM33_1926 [Caulobacteraceae bacterium]|nr:hypothetical protein [Caulobacteraceae bacterium]
MLDPTLFILAGGGLAVGATVAQLRGPTYWSWEGRVGDLHRRLSCLPRSAPPVVRRAAGMAALATLLTGGALTAYAAEPSAPPPQTGQAAREAFVSPGGATAPTRLAAATVAAAPAARPPTPTGPDALPAQVTGVIGSGNQLSLQLKPVGNADARTLKPGDTFEDGWVLTALTPSAATLSKGGASRTVGLNPTGTLAGPAAPGGATVTVVSNLQNQVATALQSAQAATASANAAYNAAPPEARTALEDAVNAARRGMIDAQNYSLSAQNYTLCVGGGLGNCTPPTLAATPAPPRLGLAEAQTAYDRATQTLAAARADAAPATTLQSLQIAVNSATITLDNAKRSAAANAAQGAGQ